MKRSLLIACPALLALGAGCQGGRSDLEQRGKVYYLDGAGNLGFGSAEVPRGLREGGFQGDVEPVIWTTSFNPLIDQVNIFAALAAGRSLAGKIKQYKERHPEGSVDIIALSAGTGVAVWACEQLDERSAVDNLVLLGSSLSNDYDLNKALPNIRGRVYCYHSPQDAVLQTVELVGTIDRKSGVKSAGQVGLHPPRGAEGKIVNIPWSRQYEALGWYGGHTDCTNVRFVRQDIAPRILPNPPRSPDSEVRISLLSGHDP
jgi:hypothetical protein